MAEPSNNRRNRYPQDPPIGPQNRPNQRERDGNQEGIFMTPREISELVERAVQRAMEKRPVREPSRDVSCPEHVRGSPRERRPREGQGAFKGCFKLFEYDGTTDPWEHVCRFKNISMVYLYTDGVKGRVFATTLTNAAQTWFSQLEDGIIYSFDQLVTLFLHQFASSRRKMRSTQTLFGVRQKDNEPLRAFLKRFISAKLESP